MASTASARSSYREFLIIAAPAALAVAFAFWFAYQFVEPAPPAQVKITTGSKTGAYYNFAKRYAALLAKSDITLEVESSEGSLSNLLRLRDENSGVTLGFLQGGITNHREDPELVSLGRVFLEPVWVFYNGADRLERVAQLKGKRIAIGGKGSGTRVLALALLKANDLNENNTMLLPLSGTAAAKALKAGDADAVFLVLSPQAKLVGQMLRNPNIHLLNFKQAEAYTRIFQYLSRVTLPAGVIDLDQQVPKEDVTLVAAQAALVARKDVHPAIVGLMVQAAKEVHRPGGIFARFEEFPKAYDPEFPMQNDAERLYKRGPPFLQRFLPFWMANFIERTLIMLIPMATIMLPLFKIVPWLYEWRIRRRILYWYGELKRFEKSINEKAGAIQPDHLAEVQRIEQAVGEIPVPLHFSDKLYELRAAVDLVRKRIAAKV